MTNYSNTASTAEAATTTTRRPTRDEVSETKPAYKTTEFIVYILAVLAVLIASAVIDKPDDGQPFPAHQAWMYVTWLTVGYMVSRGLAKSGVSRRDRDDA